MAATSIDRGKSLPPLNGQERHGIVDATVIQEAVEAVHRHYPQFRKAGIPDNIVAEAIGTAVRVAGGQIVARTAQLTADSISRRNNETTEDASMRQDLSSSSIRFVEMGTDEEASPRIDYFGDRVEIIRKP